MYADQITLGVQTGPDRTGRFEKALVDGLTGIRRTRHNTQSETGGQEVPSSNLGSPTRDGPEAQIRGRGAPDIGNLMDHAVTGSWT